MPELNKRLPCVLREFVSNVLMEYMHKWAQISNQRQFQKFDETVFAQTQISY